MNCKSMWFPRFDRSLLPAMHLKFTTNNYTSVQCMMTRARQHCSTASTMINVKILLCILIVGRTNVSCQRLTQTQRRQL
jgi:hypothetical protein